MYAVTHFVRRFNARTGSRQFVCCLRFRCLASHIVLDAIPHSDYSKIVHGVLDLAAVATIACISIRAGAGRSALTLED
jgi:hypothetical protein